LKRERRHSRDAEIEVICPGMLEVLSVGKGDIKISLDNKNPADVANARKLIEEMMSKGYGIFVETDTGLSRVKKFNPKRMTYVITEFVEPAEPAVGRPGRRTRDRDVPVAGSKAKAIGRTAGG
jgi:hypothetical protein